MVAVETPLKQGWNKPMFLMNFLRLLVFVCFGFFTVFKIFYIFL